MRIRRVLEESFESWSEVVVRRPLLVLMAVLGVTGALLPQLRNIWMDFSIESYLARTDPSLVAYDAFREQFGSDTTAIIVVETDNVFTLEHLSRFKSLHGELEEGVPHLHQLTSLVNVRYVHGDGDELVVEDLEKRWPLTETEIPAFRKLVLEHPLYVGTLISEDSKYAAIIAEAENYSSKARFSLGKGYPRDAIGAVGINRSQSTGPVGREVYLEPEEEEAFVVKISELAAEFDEEDFNVYVAGTPVTTYRLTTDMGREIMIFMGLGIVLIALFLGLLFRRISGIVLPVLVVQLSVLTTMALMPLLGYPFTSNTQVLPTFLLTVGVADAVHILAIFYQRYDQGEQRRDAVTYAMKHTAFAVVMTSLTTAAGLISFTFTDLMPVISLGIFGAIGVILAQIYTITLLPATLALLPIKRRTGEVAGPGQDRRGLHRIEKRIVGLGEFSSMHPKGVLAGTLVLCVVLGLGMTRLVFSHDPIRWYPKDHPTRIATELVDEVLSGTQTLEILVDTGEENGLYEPKVMNFLNEISNYCLSLEVFRAGAKKVVSILDVLKEIHQALNDDVGQDFYVVPQERATIAQELLLFESSGSVDLEDLVDAGFRLARMTVILPWTNSIDNGPYVETLRAGIEERSQGLDLEVQIVGVMVNLARTLEALSSMAKSYVLAFLFVAVLMVLLMGSLRGGLLAMIPNLIPILFTLGLMGWIGIPLNMLTTLIGCIIIGIAVDDTIHFMHHFRKYALEVSEPREAVRLTMEKVGRALFFTSLVLGGGFLIFLVGQFSSTRAYGVLLGFAITVALLADFMVAPALMTLLWDKKLA
jgi:predicted RND superfamily exporter protein